MMMKKIRNVALSLMLSLSLAGCAAADAQTAATQTSQVTTTQISSETTATSATETTPTTQTTTTVVEGSKLDTTEIFSERDLEQTADLTDAVTLQLTSNEDVVLNEAGVYVLSGNVENVTVLVEAADDAKVQIVLDGVTITNQDAPAIYVKTADKVFVTTTSSDNHLEVTGNFTTAGETTLDAVIFSKEDLVFNGTGTLNIVSATGNGVTSKDELKVTGGTYVITATEDGVEANDAINIYDGTFTITTYKDAFHSENTDDTSFGTVYIKNGTFNISAADDAIHGNSIVQIDGGTINIATCAEGIEGTYVQINGGDISINAKDDGINASAKSNYDVVVELNGGNIQIAMGSGDTDAVDSNGNIYVNGGTINIEATSAFDSDGTATLNGGTVTVNGEVITQIVQQQMGGGGGGKRR